VKPSAKLIAPLLVLASAILVAVLLVASRPDVTTVRVETAPPLVDVVAVRPTQAALRIRAQGTVEPRTESDLVAEVAGRVVWVSPHLASGGFFSKDDPLVRVDARDMEIELEAARARLARARSDAANAKTTLDRQRQMREQRVSSKARFDAAQNAANVAEAVVREARVAVRRAELDLERTEIRAPFDGRVREKRIDVGQFIVRGSPVARIYAVDYAEIRLPVSDEDSAFLDLPLAYGAPDANGVGPDVHEDEGPAVLLSAGFAGRRHTWQGRVVRTEGALDPRTRMIHVVARVEDPYARSGPPGSTPLPIGLFVDAEIEGRVVDDVFELPWAALREQEGAVVVVDEDERLRLRRVGVFRRERGTVWIHEGLSEGERVVTTPLDVFVEGMLVRTGRPQAAEEPAS
jgi:RND family efflux transporter MFP subunit